MAEAIKWKPKLDADRQPIPRCWLTDTGYTVAEILNNTMRFTITRPGDAVPFGYTDQSDDVAKLITADMQPCAAMDQPGEAV